MLVLLNACKGNDASAGAELIAPDTSHTDLVKTLNVSSQMDTATFDYNHLIGDIRYVQLETNDNCLIGQVSKLIPTDSGFVVADYYFSKSVFFFSKEGRFIQKIRIDDRKGFPKAIRDIAYNPQLHIVYIYDDKYGAIGCYTEKGNYLRMVKTGKFRFRRFACLKDSLLVFYKPYLSMGAAINDYEIVIGDLSQNVFYKAFPEKNEVLDNYDYNINVNRSGGKVFYSRKFSNYVYEINGNQPSITPFLRFYSSDKTFINDKIKPEISLSEFDLLQSGNTVLYDGSILLANDICYVGFLKHSKDVSAFYSLKTGHIVGGQVLSVLGANDSLDIESFTYPVASHDSEFISLLYPENIKQSEKLYDSLSSIHQSPPINRSAVLRDLLKKTDASDNPILLLYKLKPF